MLGTAIGATVTSHDPLALQWFWPDLPAPEASHNIHDAGSVEGKLPEGGVVVLRGPCSMATVTLARTAGVFEHLVVIREPGRPLRRQDVEAAVGREIDVEIPLSGNIARLMDAGLLRHRLDELPELAAFSAWARTAFAEPTQQPS